MERGGLAWWIAVCRETLEEAGLLLAAGEVPSEEVATLRARVLEDETVFADLLLERGLQLDASAIEEVGRFITPPGPPRRFDARFFVAHAPVDQVASHDDTEIVNCEWVRPQEALDRWAAGEMAMMSPTVRMVACLSRFDTADQVMATARRRLEYKRVRVDDPEGAYRSCCLVRTGTRRRSSRSSPAGFVSGRRLGLLGPEPLSPRLLRIVDRCGDERPVEVERETFEGSP